MKQIVVSVSDDGEVRIETKGFSGKSCLEEAQFLKDLLGVETAQYLTAAYYQNENEIQTKAFLPLCG